jgi:hypothetical protein
MEDGTLVTVGKTGTKVYKAYKTDDTGWRYLYTLVPADGVGRKRYRVLETKMRPFVSAKVEEVHTSRGRVRRPKSFRSQYPEYSGCTRRAYIGKEWVFKVAKYAGDNYKNRVEAARYAAQTGMPEDKIMTTFGADAARALTRYEGVPIAECHLLPDGVLMMERVKPIYNLNADEGADMLTNEERRKRGYERPSWAGAVDCEQIGYNRNGDLVAFDL